MKKMNEEENNKYLYKVYVTDMVRTIKLNYATLLCLDSVSLQCEEHFYK